MGYYVDGLAHQDEVGIYQVSNESLLVSTLVTVTATGDGNPTANPPVFDYASIAPVTLSAGTEYVVVGFEAYNLAGQYVTADGNVDAAAGIVFNGYAYDYNSDLDIPTISYDPGYFGPNFQFTFASSNTNIVVPLPASALGGSALLGLMFVVKARSRKNVA